MNEVNVLNEFYRSVIGPTMKEIYVNLNPVVSLIMEAGGKGKISRKGEDIIFEQGGYYQGYSNARLRRGETGRSYDTTIRHGRVTPEQATMRWEVDTEMLVFEKAEQGQELARYLSIMASRWINGWKDSYTIDTYGDGTGTLAAISTVGISGANNIVITEPQVMRKLPEGMFIDVGTDADFLAGNDASIQRRKVIRQISEYEFEVDNAATLVAGMTIRRELTRNGSTYTGVAADKTNISTFHGLKSNMVATGSLFGIPRDLVHYQPLVETASASAGLTFENIVDFNTKALHLGMEARNYVLPINQYNVLLKGFASDIVTNTKSEAFLGSGLNYNEGISSVSFTAGKYTTRLFTDELLDSDVGYSLDSSSWRMYEAVNGIMVYGDGQPYVSNFGSEITGKGLVYDASEPHVHAIEAVRIGQLAAIQPRSNSVINFS